MKDERTKGMLRFIGSLSGWEVKFVKDTIQIGCNIRIFIDEAGKDFDVAKFCDSMKISKNDYEDFITGNWEYSLREISAFETIWAELRKSKVKVENIKVKS